MNDEFEQFGSYDTKAAEERAKAGGMIPPGKYPARLNGATRTESRAKQTPGWELTFLITEGAFAGSEVTETLYITEHAKSKDRLAIFASRLGLLVKKADGTGYERAEGKTDFRDCIDSSCVIEVVHEPDQKDPQKKWTRIPFAGIWRTDDPEVRKGKGPSGGSGNGKPPTSAPPSPTTEGQATDGTPGKATTKGKAARANL